VKGVIIKLDKEYIDIIQPKRFSERSKFLPKTGNNGAIIEYPIEINELIINKRKIL
jgi:hypothetical protein